MNLSNDRYEQVKHFYQNVNLSLIEHQQLIHSFEILREKIEDLRIPEDEKDLNQQVHRIESLAAVLISQFKACYETDQDAADSFEHKYFFEQKGPTSAATEISK